jgi:hypothetical protein
MAVFLVHIAAGSPVGVWRLDGEHLSGHHYPAEHAALQGKAQAALDAKGDTVPWLSWFRRLSERSPYFDDYALFDGPDDLDLAGALARFTQGWQHTT